MQRAIRVFYSAMYPSMNSGDVTLIKIFTSTVHAISSDPVEWECSLF